MCVYIYIYRHIYKLFCSSFSFCSTIVPILLIYFYFLLIFSFLMLLFLNKLISFYFPQFLQYLFIILNFSHMFWFWICVTLVFSLFLFTDLFTGLIVLSPSLCLSLLVTFFLFFLFLLVSINFFLCSYLINVDFINCLKVLSICSFLSVGWFDFFLLISLFSLLCCVACEVLVLQQSVRPELPRWEIQI